MGTRSTIIIEGVNYAKIYKHWDGYPEATLAWLQAFNGGFDAKQKAAGNWYEPEFKFAELLKDSVAKQEQFNLCKTGWAVMPFDDDCWAEYVYTLKADGTVECYSVFAEKLVTESYNGEAHA